MNKIKHFFEVYSLRSMARRFWFNVAKLPMLAHHRPYIIKLAGVDVQDFCYIHNGVQFDTVHPERIHLAYKCAISTGVIIITHYRDTSRRNKIFTDGDVYIGKEVLLGQNTIITKPVTIGDGAIVGAGSVVTKDIPPYEVCGGNPAHFLKKRVFVD